MGSKENGDIQAAKRVEMRHLPAVQSNGYLIVEE